MSKHKLSPHDRFTRSAMSNSKVAEEFFQQNLPEHIKKAIDFSSLKLQKESFVDNHLKMQVADLLYSVNFNGKPGFLYILLEHTSTSQPLLPFRMLKYMISIMDSYLKTAKDNKDLKLPLIYPLILYNGKTRYSHSLDLFDLFEKQDKELAKEMLLSPCHLIDLTQASDEELQKFIWFGSMALALKHIHDSDILPFLQSILKLVAELEKYDANSYIYSIVAYIAKAGKIPHEERWMETIQTIESADQENIMTLMNLLEKLQPQFERYMEQKVTQKVMEKGIEKGEHQKALEIAKALLSHGVALDTIAKATNLPKEDIKKLLS